ncbi:MAG: hypothetical protein IKI95_03155 [Clostridia bacterium]|nr:hypothetical protein [Clostridia bacterium]
MVTQQELQNLIQRFIRNIEDLQSIVKKDYLTVNSDLEEQANNASEQEYNRLIEIYTSENDDISALLDKSQEVGLEKYLLLKVMRYRNLANWICNVIEIWEQQMYLLYSEIKQDGRKFNNFNQLVKEIENLGLQISGMIEYHNLENKRLLVNVIKHSEGTSEEKLRNECPKYFDNSTELFGDMDNLKTYKTSLGEVALNITEEDFDETCFQIIDFWKAIL